MWDFVNFTCSPGPAAESWDPNCSDSIPSPLARLIPIAEKSYSKDKSTESFRLFQYGTTFEHSTENPSKEKSTSFPAVFLAKTFPNQNKTRKGSKDHGADFGSKWRESFVKFDPDSSSWKTRQRSLFGDWEKFLATWPKWGSMRNGECWALDTSERLTKETEFGFWPTPTAGCHNLGESPTTFLARQNQLKREKKIWGSMPIAIAVQVVPKDEKPTSSFGAAGDYSMKRETFPTPQARDWKGGSDWTKRTRDGKPRRVSDQSLPDRVETSGNPGKLNPDWTEWLMGWPIGFSASGPLEMDKFQAWLDLHSKH